MEIVIDGVNSLISRMLGRKKKTVRYSVDSRVPTVAATMLRTTIISSTSTTTTTTIKNERYKYEQRNVANCLVISSIHCNNHDYENMLYHDVEAASIQALDAEIMRRFEELRQFAVVQLGLDMPPVHAMMLESLYFMKMGALRDQTEEELSKFESSLYQNIDHECKRYQKFKVVVCPFITFHYCISLIH